MNIVDTQGSKIGMTILGRYSSENFLQNYWQKQPLLIRGASQNYGAVLSADELAGMACEDQVESRLIIESGHLQDEDSVWKLENGPFDESRFAELPEKNWTLLVQSVDQWIPEVRDILEEFDFLPSWRLDDVMVSYATTGGGVGPHFDYYDVFLLQTSGKRRWKLGQHCKAATPLRHNQPLKLLESFEQTQEFELEAGDMLYIPAGLAHWGTALDDQCMTWSIGFRAPSSKELLLGAIDVLADKLPDDLRYKDSHVSLEEYAKGCKGEMGSRVRDQLKSVNAMISQDAMLDAMQDVLGAIATEPRYPDLVEHLADEDLWSLDALKALFNRDYPEDIALELNPSSRLAFRQISDIDNCSKLYVNGETWQTDTRLAKLVCTGNVNLASFSSGSGRDATYAKDLTGSETLNAPLELLLRLINSGVYWIDA